MKTITYRSIYPHYFQLEIHERINHRQNRNALNINYLYHAAMTQQVIFLEDTLFPVKHRPTWHHGNKQHSLYPTKTRAKTLSCENSIFKHIMKKCFEKVEAMAHGYYMGCLISEEFTPAPDYSQVQDYAISLCKKYEVDFRVFVVWLKNRHEWRDDNDPVNGGWSEYEELLDFFEFKSR